MMCWYTERGRFVDGGIAGCDRCPFSTMGMDQMLQVAFKNHQVNFTAERLVSGLPDDLTIRSFKLPCMKVMNLGPW